MTCSSPIPKEANPSQSSTNNMKLTRFQLVHATDKQLDAIGIKRRLNAGWLKRALEKDLTRDELDNFSAALVKKGRAVIDFELKQQFHHVLASIKAKQLISAQDAARKILEIVTDLQN